MSIIDKPKDDRDTPQRVIQGQERPKRSSEETQITPSSADQDEFLRRAQNYTLSQNAERTEADLINPNLHYGSRTALPEASATVFSNIVGLQLHDGSTVPPTMAASDGKLTRNDAQNADPDNIGTVNHRFFDTVENGPSFSPRQTNIDDATLPSDPYSSNPTSPWGDEPSHAAIQQMGIAPSIVPTGTSEAFTSNQSGPSAQRGTFVPPPAGSMVATSSTVELSETATGSAVVAVLATGEEGTEIFTYQLVGDPSHLFMIVGDTLRLRPEANVDFETAPLHTLAIRVTNSQGAAIVNQVTVDITDFNEFAVSTATDTNAVANTVAENASVGTTVGVTANASDADGTTNAVTYSLVGGTGEFAIDANTGVVTVAGAINYEAGPTRTITVQALSADGSTSTQTFTVNVTDADEFAVSTATDTNAAANTVAENATVGTTVGVTANATDADGTTNAVTYSLVGGTGEFAIDANTGVVTVAGAINYEAGPTRTITVQALSADGSTLTQTFTINVTDVNEFAVSTAADTNAGANTVAENATVGTTVGVTANASDADGTTNAVTYSLVGGTGEFAIDANTGVVTVAGAINYEAGPTRTITVQALSADGSTSTQTFTVNVTDVNEFAVSTATDTNSAANTVAENATVGTTVGITATATDSDGTTNTVTYSLVGGTGEFAIDANTGVVTVAGAINYEAGPTRTITVQALSADGSTSTQTFTVNVTDVNEFAVTTATDTNAGANTVAENATVGTTVGVNANATDADGTTNAVTYSLVGGTGEFAIDANTGVVTVAGAINYEAGPTRTITVQALSADGSTSTQTFTVNVTDVNEFAVTTATDTNAAANTVAENATIGTTVGVTANATDADGTTNAVTYSLVGGTGEFAIDANTGVVTVAGAINYEAGPTRTITVQALSADGSTSNQTFTVNVTDVNEFAVSTATDTNAAANTVAENATVGTTVGVTANATDADGTTNAVTYSLVGGTGEFAIDANTGVVTVAGAINYEAGPTRTITVQALSADGSTSTQTFTVNVTDVNEFAVSTATDTNSAANTVAENATVGTTVGVTANATDADGTTNAVTYSLVGGTGEFAINATTGVVTVAGAINYEAGPTRTITVQALSADGSTSTQTFTVNVTDVNEFAVSTATDTNAGANTVAENATVGTTVGVTANATDADGTTNAVTYSLVGGTGEFGIDANTGVVTVAGAINYEAGPTRTITVQALSADGSTSTQTFTVNVTDVNEFAVSTASDTNAAANTVAENATVGTTVGVTVNATDADGTTNAVTYSLVGGTGEFAIDANTGVVTVAGAINYEAGPTRTITVQALSADGSTSNQTFTVNVTDVNEFAVTTATDTNAATNTVAENATVGTTVGVTANATDADGTTNAVTYSLVGGTGEFAIDANTGVVTVAGAISYEAGPTRTITVQALSADGSTSTQTFTVNVTDVNEFAVSTATDTNVAVNTVAENATVGTTVGVTANATDADGTTNAVTYSLVGGTGEFAINATTGVVTVAGTINYEAGPTRTITVQVLSADGSTSTQTFTVNVTDVNEFAVSTASDTNAAANTVAENATVGTTVGVTANATDADGTINAVTYSLVGGTGEFAIDANTGVVTVAGAINYEAGPTRTITVQALSADGSTSTQTFTINVTNTAENVVLTSGNDVYVAGSVAELSVGGGAGHDSMTGGSGNDVFTGGAGNDTLVGGSGNDIAVFSGASTDYTFTLSADGTITVVDNRGASPDGTDTLSGFETLRFSDGDYALNLGTNGADNMSAGGVRTINLAGAGNDTIVGRSGIDIISGGTGTDTVDYSGSNAGVNVSLASNTGSGGHAQGDSYQGIDNVIGSIYNDTVVAGMFGSVISTGTGNDSIWGGAGADSIDAGANDDTIMASTGGDTLAGGTGTDTLSFASATQGVTFNNATTAAQNTGATFGTITASGFETIIGGSGNDALTGDSGANAIVGGLGNDTISGGAGNDTLSGGAGQDYLSGGADNDLLIGGTGRDTLDGGSGTDTADYSAEASGIAVDLSDTGLQARFTFENIASGVAASVAGAQAISATLMSGATTRTSGDTDLSLNGAGGYASMTGLKIGGSSFTISADVTFDRGINSGNYFERVIEIGDGEMLNNITIARDAESDQLYFEVVNGGVSSGYARTAEGTIVAGQSMSVTATFDNGVLNLYINGQLAATETASFTSVPDKVHTYNYIGKSCFTSDDPTQGTIDNIQIYNRALSATEVSSDQAWNVENVIGSNDGDSITGSSSANSIDAGSGNDTVVATAGGDTLMGGAGNDTIDFSGAGSAITFNLSNTGTQATGGFGNVTASGFEAVVGSGYNDSLTGTNANDTIIGGAGNDTIIGDTGTNLIVNGSFEYGYSNNNYNYVYSGGSWTNSTSGAPVEIWANGYNGQSASDGTNLLELDADNAVDAVGQNVSTIAGQTYTVSFDMALRNGTSASSQNFQVYWNNSLIGQYVGGSANWSTVNINVVGTGGSDRLEFRELAGESNSFGALIDNVKLFAGGNDYLDGGAGADFVDGSAGNDTIMASLGGDTLIGGLGSDTLSFANATGAVTFNAVATWTQYTGAALGNVTASGFETLVGSNYNDTLFGVTGSYIEGGQGDDALHGAGGASNITLSGGTGNDALYADGATGVVFLAGLGNDSMYGNAYDTTVDYSGSTGGVYLDQTNNVWTDGMGGTDFISGVTRFVGSDYNDFIRTNSYSSYDYAFGGEGNDTIVAGNGDTIDGGVGWDTLDTSWYGAALTINMSTGQVYDNFMGSGAGYYSFTNIEQINAGIYNDSIVGNSSDNIILAGTGNDTVSGGAGNDTIDGGAGNDVLLGGAGNDSLIGGAGTDTVSYADATAAVTVNLSTITAQNTGGGGTDTLSGFENLTGSNYNDTLTGDANANLIVGGAGNDILAGGQGSDSFDYYMGDGNDTIYGGAGASWTDTIDVNSGTINLGNYGTDWTVALTSGSVTNTDSAAHILTLSQDASGTINLSDGSTISFQEIERITW